MEAASKQRSRGNPLVMRLVDALQSLPHSRATIREYEPRAYGTAFDARVEARVGDQPLDVLVEAKAQVYPRDARELAARWQALASDACSQPPAPRHLIVAAETISPGARAILVADGVGFFAAGGSLCLPFPGAYVYVERPSVSKEAKSFKLFTNARTPVLHALLLAPGEWHSVQELAVRSGVSSASVSKLLARLEQEEWVQTQGSGPSKMRRLAKPADMLDAWVAAEADPHSAWKARRFFVPGRKATDMLPSLAQALRNEGTELAATYQVTAEAAAQHYAPFLTSWSTTTLRARSEVCDQLMAELGAKEVQQGANLQIIEDGPSSLRFHELQEGIFFASPVQTYVDLMRSPGRAQDAARHLRERVLGY